MRKKPVKIMSKNKDRMIAELEKRGFTDKEVPFELFYWVHDGWYLHCDQVLHQCIGYNTQHVINEIKNGQLDHFLKL